MRAPTFTFRDDGTGHAVGDGFVTRWGLQAFDLGFRSWESVYEACANVRLPGGFATPDISAFRKLRDAKRGPSPAVRLSLEHAGFDVQQCECGVPDGRTRLYPWLPLDEYERVLEGSEHTGAARAPQVVFWAKEVAAALLLRREKRTRGKGRAKRTPGKGLIAAPLDVARAFASVLCDRAARSADGGRRFWTDPDWRDRSTVTLAILWTEHFAIATTDDERAGLCEGVLAMLDSAADVVWRGAGGEQQQPECTPGAPQRAPGGGSSGPALAGAAVGRR